ncbi:RNA polymerase sigma factor, sigma-70 family [Thermomonospora echinospora]|uniref:RNA polymerase sigma factor, sigma-70 family n=1 Tax=Thermomonospora echinospora TaxID=1992 RepID=A0A1H5XTP6_9ACTN|nr:sigma-70 family RNA polymerase sigma factor [Thermomonospora echinospora]SEG14905.1 RNA polymerase sigma factor, sigma-70 family [Thermomonospora echinospora]
MTVPKGMGAAAPGELVLRARAGDDTAWAALTDRYSAMLWAIARGHGLGPADAADVVQLTWLRLVEHIGALRRPDRVGAWLAVTARRESARTLRHRGRSEERSLEALPDPVTPEAVLAGRERLRAVFDAIGALPGLCQQMLRLLALSPTYAEVSAALDIPVSSVGPARARCLASLRKRLEGSA